MIIIGLSGKARCGKDTVGQHIMNIRPDVETYALADPLKEAAAIMFNIELDDFYNQETKEAPNEFWGISPREIAQKVGTECARNVFREDFWLKRCESQMSRPSDIFVVTDVRFENEAEWIRSRGGSVWHIDRPSLGVGVVREHASEAGIEFRNGDVRISNNGTVGDLMLKVQNLLNTLD